MSIKSTKLAVALLGGLSFAAPLAAMPAAAAPFHKDAGMTLAAIHNDMGRAPAFGDRNHQPPARHEARPRMPHDGYRWHEGRWQWQRNQWQWSAGFWNVR